ncbi:hypothetical protein M413DRAFT_423894 [Hebeloma cylindrosporum]|uniref:Uncharacterized protein n=1 Tax=Hebeloma cylindrosporum TaxID=76867 RepID=A0A0C3BYD9_HEBCY|nr:hypothetical protein M413DRAFT_423894 [Hebeloma cylindrosporum h7]
MPMYSASIDDNDAAITYASNWYFITSDPPWTGTMHSTSTFGDQAIFRFTGSGFAVICIIPTGDGTSHSRATVSVDHEAPVTVSRATTGPVQYEVVLFDSGPLAFGTHSVSITNTGTDAYLRLDRIDYDPTDHTPTLATNGNLPTTTVTRTTVQQSGSSQGSSSQGSSSSSPEGTVITPSSGVSVSVETVTLSSTSTVSRSPALLPSSDATGLSDASAASAKTVPTAAIAGGAVGAVVFIMLLGVLLIFLCRRRKKDNAQTPFSSREGSAANLHRGNDTVPTPFQMISYLDNPYSMASNFIPTADRKGREHFDNGTYGVSRTISSRMSPNSPPSSTSAAPLLRSHSHTSTNVSMIQSTSLDFSRSDAAQSGSGPVIRETAVPSGSGRATLFSPDNRNMTTSYLTEAPPPAYGDVL